MNYPKKNQNQIVKMNREYCLIMERFQQMREIKKKNSKKKLPPFRRNPKKESYGLG